MENKHINYKGKIIELPQISSEDEACEILKDVDFTSAEDLTKAVVSVANYIESTKSALQALETALTEKHRAEVEGLRNALIKIAAEANKSGDLVSGYIARDALLTTNPKEEK